jgi:hypothetical protein
MPRLHHRALHHEGKKVSGTISDISHGFLRKQTLPDNIDERRESCIAPAWFGTGCARNMSQLAEATGMTRVIRGRRHGVEALQGEMIEHICDPFEH